MGVGLGLLKRGEGTDKGAQVWMEVDKEPGTCFQQHLNLGRLGSLERAGWAVWVGGEIKLLSRSETRTPV